VCSSDLADNCILMVPDCFCGINTLFTFGQYLGKDLKEHNELIEEVIDRKLKEQLEQFKHVLEYINNFLTPPHDIITSKSFSKSWSALMKTSGEVAISIDKTQNRTKNRQPSTFINKKHITIQPLIPSEVASMMAEKGINGVPILDDKGNLIGMITRTDILQVYPDQREKKKAEEIMSRDLVVIEQNASLYNAFKLMTGNQVGRLPVVDPLDNKKMIGLITREDIGRVYNIEIQSRLEEIKLSGSIE